ncbi:MAG: hypothetical protein ACPG8W_05550 [Candidatus Promineifilaceae bacterium]
MANASTSQIGLTQQRGSVFEVNETYENRKGVYTVLSITGPKMKVRFADGSTANLRMNIQERIWENIVAEREAAAAKAAKKPSSFDPDADFYIKTISIAEESDLAIPGLKQRLTAAPRGMDLGVGARLVYFAVEPALFFAVATITAKPKSGRAKDYIFGASPKVKIHVYPIDVDAHIEIIAQAISVDAVELESVPNHAESLTTPFKYHKINEDDFELLAELIAEVGEEEDADKEVEADPADVEMELEIDA